MLPMEGKTAMTASTADTADTADTATELSQERRDLLDLLRTRRFFLRQTARDLTDEQAGTRSTVSALSVAGLIKHVTATESTWARFIVEGPSAFPSFTGTDWSEYENQFRMVDGETLAGLLQAYQDVAARTDTLVGTVDLDASWPLPEAPWFEPGAVRTARQSLLHIATETAQHAGHADIIRESIDGAKTMG
jgi:uncharacterized damage-inducible protein DinB